VPQIGLSGVDKIGSRQELAINSIQAPIRYLCRELPGSRNYPPTVAGPQTVPVTRISRAKDIMSKRKLQMKMKTFAALFAGCWLLSGVAARAEKIDFSTTTCKQFLEMKKNEIGLILAWLDGYYRDEDDPPIFDTDKFEDNAKKLAGYCAANPSVGLITAADKLFGD
jgi:acid stress chaperone HdeB